MSRHAAVLVVLAAVLALPTGAQERGLRAADLALARVERALDAAAARPADVAAAEAELRPLAAGLVARIDAQRSSFRTVAEQALPAQAAARLAQAEAAFEAGQGRLGLILSELVLTAAGDDGPARRDAAARGARASLAREAREILARLEAASRPEPLSSELKLRAPSLRPPALPAVVAGPAAPGRAAEAPAAAVPIGVVPPELQSLADQLAGPFEVYAWVRRNVAPEFYYGAAKGALATYHDQRGNDADGAALLITLLRAKGVPARFVIGTAEIPADTLRRLVGVEGSVEDAVRVLERAGIPNEPVLGPGGLSSVKVARVWVEAYVPYVNYRGLDLDPQGKAWVPLDAAFQLFVPAAGVDVVGELGFDPRAAWDEYMQEQRSEAPLEFVRARVEALLQAQRPGTSYADALGQRATEPETLGILPNTLPYVATVAERAFDLPVALTHELRLVGKFQGTTVLDATFPAGELIGRRVTLSYAPFSEEDATVVALFGGMYQTPPYLFEVRPVISLDGVEAAAGAAPVGFGVKYGIELELRTPAGGEHVANTVLAGNLTALAVAGSRRDLPALPDDAAGRILSGLATRYLARWNAADDEWSRLMRVVAVRPTLSAAFLMSAVEVDYAGGDPLYPLTFDWKGVDVDADFRPLAPVGIEHREREASFALLSGLSGSVLEARILEDDLQVPAVSTVGAIQSAYADAIPVLDVTRDNAEAVVPDLPFDATVKAEVLDAALRGRLVRIPSEAVSNLAWTGVGYVVLDEETGEAAYQLQGGHSGGTTAPAVNELPARWSLPLRGYNVGPYSCSGPPPYKVEMKSPDNQFGLVNKKLDEPLRVLVLDSQSRPLRGACVTFTVVGGGGRLTAEPSGIEDRTRTVFSDSEGIAKVELRLGEHTKDLPGYWCEDGRTCGPGQDEYTQVGFNVVAVRAGAAIMPGTFTHYAKPDPNCDQAGVCQTTLKLTTPAQRGGPFNLQIGGLMGARVTDRYENPVSNIKVRFRFDTLTLSLPPAGWYRTRGLSSSAEASGLVLKSKDYLDCIAANPNPGRHDCAGEAAEHELASGPFGVYAYSVIGDSTYSDYRYEITTTRTRFEATATFSTAGWLCSVPDVHACGLDWPQTIVTTTTRPRRVNAAGNFIEAYPVEGSGDLTVAAHVLEEQQEPVPPDPPQSDGCGPIYRARGNNAWKRKPLTNSSFTLSAATPGTGVPGSAGHVGNGVYRAEMTMAPTPQENRARIASRHFPGVVHLLDCPSDRDRVDTGRSPIVTVDGTRQFQRTPEPPSRPWQGTFEFPLWGAQVKIEKVEPQPSYVTEEGRTTHPTLVRHKILPDPWRALLDPVQVYFKVAKAGGPAIIEGTGNSGEVFTLPRDLSMPADTYEARLEVQSVSLDGGKIEAMPAQVRTAVANFLLDFNNDTVVDQRDADEARQHPAAAFGFWDADSLLEGQRQLQDYATLVVRLPEDPAPDEQLFIRLDRAGTGLVLVPKLPAGATARCPADKAYLCNADAATAQWAAVQSSTVRSMADAVALPTSLLRAGDNAFLFRCEPGLIDVAGCSGKVMTLERQIAGNAAAVIDRSVDLRSPRQWMSAVTVRQPFVADEAGADVSALPGWAEIPENARRVFVFAHGYNVSAGGAQSNWFPLLLKRFYWAGLPMLSVQGTDSNGRPHFVGLTWPGDQALTEFGVDEFNALQSGVPIGLFLARNLKGREVRVMAHSLGNMAVSSALNLIPPGTVKYFVMNDAAVPAEAYSNAYVPDGLETNVMRPEAAEHGYPNDDAPPAENWEGQWQSMNAHPSRPDLTCLYTPLPLFPPLSKWNANLANMNPNLTPRPQYNIRYRKFGMNGNARLGPWVGLFSAASTGGTNLINTYNPFDDVVRIDDGVGSGAALHYWFLAQSLQKPFSGWILGTVPNDGNCVQYWGRLQETDVSQATENELWSVGQLAPELGRPSAQQRARLTRRWGELAYWFTPLSGGAGTQALRGVAGGVRNMEFPHPRSGNFGFDSHSYMNEFPFHEVWNHYVDLADILK